MLMELRPAMEGFAGIPQETRLLFTYLQDPEQRILAVDGLLNSFHIPYRPRRREQPLAQTFEQARYILSISERPSFDKRLDRYVYYLVLLRRFAGLAAGSISGSKSDLLPLDGRAFYDFIWQKLFAKTVSLDSFSELAGRRYFMNALGWYEMHRSGILWGVYPRVNTDQWDFALMQTPYPGNVSENTKLIIRYHDAIPLYMPQHISDAKRHMSVHYHALQFNSKRAWFVCTSAPVREDLLRLIPKAERRVTVIPDIISDAYKPDPPTPGQIKEFCRRYVAHETEPHFLTRKEEEAFYANLKNFVYIMAVATIEPRKNYGRLISAWEDVYEHSSGRVRLIIVGEMGWNWDREREHQRMKKWTARGALFHLARVPLSALRKLYSGALVVVCPSVSEGFDFSGIEAMRCGTPVLASDIPTHRAVYADAADYFSPYSVSELTQLLLRVLAETWDERTADLVKKGHELANRYTKEAVVPQWYEFIRSLPRSKK